MEENRKPKALTIILIILLICALALCCKLWIDKNKAVKLAEDYKSSYENLVEANNKAKVKAEEYQSGYNQLVSSMLSDASLAEKTGNLITKVWHHAIYSTPDEETDKFTKINGEFVSDFNDALRNLFNDTDFIKNRTTLSNGQQQIRNRMKDMLNPPEGYENAFKALESMYNSYLEFTDIVLRCDGSYSSFSESFSTAASDLVKQYHAAELYVK